MKKIHLIAILIFTTTVAFCQQKPSIYGTWYISMQVPTDTTFVNKYPEKIIAVLSRKLDFKKNNIKHREVLKINTNNIITGSKEEADKNNKPVVEKKFITGGKYFPTTKTIHIYPRGVKNEKTITCKIMKVTATNLYLDMGKKPIEEPISEEAIEAQRIADSVAASQNNYAGDTVVEVTPATQPEEIKNNAHVLKEYDEPNREVNTYFPEVLKVETHPLLFLKDKKYNAFANYIDDKKGILVFSSVLENQGKHFTKQQFLSAVKSNETINWGKNIGDHDVLMTLEKMLSGTVELDKNGLQDLQSTIPAQTRIYGNIGIDFQEKFPNTMLLEFYQAASGSEELNWQYNVLVIDRTSKKIVGIYFIGWTI